MKLFAITILFCIRVTAQTVYYPGKDTALLKKIAKNEAYADSIDKVMIVRIDRENLVVNETMIDTVLFRDWVSTRDTTRVILQISDTSTRRLRYCCRADGSTYDTTMQVNSFVQWTNGYEIRDRNRHYIYQHVSWLDERKQVLPDKYFVWVSWRVVP